jgi:flagellar basal-body rod protein FlgB
MIPRVGPTLRNGEDMSKVFFEDNGMRTMEKFLDLAVQRQSLLSSNLANVDTPGFKTIDLSFEQELRDATTAENSRLEVTSNLHLPAGTETHSASVQQVQGLTMRNDLNNVNIDREMAQLSSNALKFSMVAQLIAGKFKTLKAAIQEGR